MTDLQVADAPKSEIQMADVPNGSINQDNNGDQFADNNPNNEISTFILERLGGVSPLTLGKSCCIHRVYEKFRITNEAAYTPQLVSIGPFHRDKPYLQAMENHKLRYVSEFLSRIEIPHIQNEKLDDTTKRKLNVCIEAVKMSEGEARNSYSEESELSSNQFIGMMVVDGIFIIEVLRKAAAQEPIFNNAGSMASLVRDLILLENQIPLFVLQKLFQLTNQNNPQYLDELERLAFKFLSPMIQLEKLNGRSFHQSAHLLDLVRNRLLSFHDSRQEGRTKNNEEDVPSVAKPRQQGRTKNNEEHVPSVTELRHEGRTKNNEEDVPSVTKLRQPGRTKNNEEHVPSVTELRQAGLKFKKGSNSGSLLDIKFTDGVLEIPQIFIQDQTDCLFRNLIAMEQCCDGYDTYMTSYAFFMDKLIDSPDDVAYLCKKGIIINYLGDNECVSTLFNKLCCEVTLVDSYYTGVCEQLDAFHKSLCNVWRKKLKRDYFNDPWSITKFLTAALLLVLTLTATIVAILDYLKK